MVQRRLISSVPSPSDFVPLCSSASVPWPSCLSSFTRCFLIRGVTLATRASKLVSKRSSKLALALHASALRSNVARTWPLAAVDARSRSEAAKARHPSGESSGLRRGELIWRSALRLRSHRERWSSGNHPKGKCRPARVQSCIDRALTAAPRPYWFLT